MAKPVVRKPKKKANPLKAAKVENIDYKDTALLRKFISDRGKIRARRVTGVSVQEQRLIATRRQERPRDGAAAVLQLGSLRRHDAHGRSFSPTRSPASVPPATSSTSRTGTPATSCSRATWPRRGPRAARSRSTRSPRPAPGREVRTLEEAKQLKGRLESASVTVPAKAGEAGRLFGAVTTADIADAVKAAGGPELDRRRIEVQGHIKSTGSYQALVRLHPDVQATVPFEVVAR